MACRGQDGSGLDQMMQEYALEQEGAMDQDYMGDEYLDDPPPRPEDDEPPPPPATLPPPHPLVNQADQNGVFVHVAHILASLFAYNEVVLLQYWEKKPVFFFAHPWFLLGILVDLIGIARYSSDKYDLNQFQAMNVASLFYCTLGIPCLAAHYHMLNGMPLRVGYAHLFLAGLPYVLFRRRKYGPLYEVTRYTIIIACLSGMFGALVSFHLLCIVAFFLILYGVERVGTGPEVKRSLSSYHWFIVLLTVANVCLALSLSPDRNIYELTPQPITNSMKYARYHMLRTPPVALFRGMMGRGQDNTWETKILYADLKEAKWQMDPKVARKGKKTPGSPDAGADEGDQQKGKSWFGKGKAKGKGAPPAEKSVIEPPAGNGGKQAAAGKLGKGIFSSKGPAGGKAKAGKGKAKEKDNGGGFFSTLFR